MTVHSNRNEFQNHGKPCPYERDENCPERAVKRRETPKSTTMNTLEALKNVPLFADLLRDTSSCPSFVLDGEEIVVPDGQRLVNEGDAGAFYVVLSGQLQVLKKNGESEMLLATHQPGTFFGELPLLLGTGFVAAGKAEGECLVWKLDDAAFWKMLAACPGITKQIMQTMAVRVKNLESIAQGHEKLVALGTMAAGLAHELNNPAAGTRHAARELSEIVAHLPALTCRLHKQNLSGEQIDFLTELARELGEKQSQLTPISPLERSDLEGEIGDYLLERDFEDADDLAATLVGAGLDAKWLECVEKSVGTSNLGAVLRWMGANLGIDGALRAVDDGTQRISDLVQSVKDYSHMDQSPAGPVDISAGLDSTFQILGHKLKYLDLRREIAPDLPPINGYAGELNQVWTNLLDNACDAVAGIEKPRIIVRAACDGEAIRVEIEDNGGGISAEAKQRLFEPFFTTKAVGKGTGLGLATSYRIVNGSHGGDLSVESEAGKTVFQVILPLGRTG